LQLQFLGERIDRFGVDCVRRAIQLHVQRGTAVGNWKYLDAILSGGAKDSTRAQHESDEIRQRLAELEKRGIRPLKAGEA
jgi:DNA replication protein DnaD